MFNKRNYLFFTLIIVIAFVSSCQVRPIYEQTTTFSEHQWNSKDSLRFVFQIEDSTRPYKLFFVVRHHNSYHYKNIWVDYTIEDPSGAKTIQSYNLYLADESKGWLGSGMGDVYDHRILVSNTPFAFKKGKYIISLRQSMREDPLQGVLTAGVRVEKVAK
jgi:gliding motility-associated lipoprotein GldH